MSSTAVAINSSAVTGVAARRTPRRSYRRPVGVLIAGRYAVVEGRSLSEGGVLFSLKDLKNEVRFQVDDFQIGARVGISLILPSGPVMVLRGTVIYHQDDGPTEKSIGIKFDVVPILQRREIRTYVSQKRADEIDLEPDALPITSKRL